MLLFVPLASTFSEIDPFGTGAGALPNPWANMMGGGMGGMGGMGGFGGMGGMGGMGGGMDPNMMNQMMQDPNFAQYMSTMLQNPQVLESMISMNPQLAAMGPEVRQMLQSPQFQQMISNPEMLRQVAQMSQQMGGMGGMGMGGMGGMGSGNMYNPWGTPTPAAATTPASTTTPPTSGATATPATPAFNPFAALGGAGVNPVAGGAPNPMAQYWAQQMAAMGAGAGIGAAAPAQPQEPPEVRFQVQLQQLNEMGFWDAAKNIRALLAAGGNVHAAIEMLFSDNI